MLTRLMFSGGGTQVLVMQAHIFLSDGRYYGYTTKDNTIGSLTPNYIEYKGKKYIITRLGSRPSTAPTTVLRFKEGGLPPVDEITIEVEGNKYILTKDARLPGYRNNDVACFITEKPYTVKILSMK